MCALSCRTPTVSCFYFFCLVLAFLTASTQHRGGAQYVLHGEKKKRSNLQNTTFIYAFATMKNVTEKEKAITLSSRHQRDLLYERDSPDWRFVILHFISKLPTFVHKTVCVFFFFSPSRILKCKQNSYIYCDSSEFTERDQRANLIALFLPPYAPPRVAASYESQPIIYRV